MTPEELKHAATMFLIAGTGGPTIIRVGI